MWVVKIVGILISLHFSHGCQMEGVATWFVPVVTQVVDVQRGVFFSRSTADILRIDSITYGEGLSGGPYVEAEYNDSVFTISTNNAYPQYEEIEISSSMTFTIVFGCSTGSTATLVFQVSVIDTNNNAPQTSSHQFTLTPPLPPGFEITGCLGDIIARDIDLTTRRVDFEIEDNPYFVIEYDEASTVAQSKEFKASLKTSTLIRSIPEPIQLTISATDVDDTGDPPITTYSVITIEANDDFQLPEEPIFAKPFYLGTYSADGVELEVISLQQGYHENVQFQLEGFEQNFELETDGNALSLAIILPLTPEIGLTQIVLVINAEREFTSGATTTVILQLPEVTPLAFEQVNYEGTIIDNVLSPLQLVLSEGSLENGLNISINEYSSFFTTTAQGNVITLTMTPLDQDIINENTFINLLVTASNDHSAATAVVTLDIVKDDLITPTFEKAIYTGQYDPETGLTIEQISLVHGYDDTVEFILDGEHETHFGLDHSGPNVTLIASSVPSDIFTEKHILLTILAIKPRTVGANAAITIDLPLARELEFESNINIGSIQEDILTLETIVLSTGFDNDVQFYLEGDYATYFNASNVQNLVTLTLTSPLPTDALTENDYITLTLFASGDYTTTTSTSVLLNILKQDDTTPVFSQYFYVGIYSENLLFIDNITLLQGHDENVTFRLDGDDAQYFGINIENSVISLELQLQVPLQTIYDEKVLLFNIIAEKPLSVSTSAVIAIKFSNDLTEPTLVSFEKNTYVGSLDGPIFNLEDIILDTGYTAETEFVLRGDLEEYFNITNTDNVVRISMSNTIPADELGDNKYILLELDAQRNRTVSIPASIIINIEEQEEETLIFAEPYYQGTYSEEFGLQFDHNISLSSGYDETVIFTLEEEYSSIFTLNINGNAISISLNQSIQEEVITENNYLVFTIAAYKTGSIPAKAAIVIDLLEDLTEPTLVSFEKNTYVGSLDGSIFYLEDIILDTGYTAETEFILRGDLEEYFNITNTNNVVRISMSNTIPADELGDNKYILLELDAQRNRTVSIPASIIINIEEQEEETLIFEEPYYQGTYTEEFGLQFDHNISLSSGYDETVIFTLEEGHSSIFTLNLNGNAISISLNQSIQEEVITENNYLVFTIAAYKTGSIPAKAAIVIDLLEDLTEPTLVSFEKNTYVGSLDGSIFYLEDIILDTGYTAETEFILRGDLEEYFNITNTNNVVRISMSNTIPADELGDNKYILLELDAQRNRTVSIPASIIINVEEQEGEMPIFEEPYYEGTYTEEFGLQFDHNISLISGYDETVIFTLEEEYSSIFTLNINGNAISISLNQSIQEEVITENMYLVFTIAAYKTGSIPAKAAIVIDLPEDISSSEYLRFSQTYYTGSYEDNQLMVEEIRLETSYTTDTNVTIIGEYFEYFQLTSQNEIIAIELISDLPEVADNVLIFILEARNGADTSHATLVIELVNLINETTTTMLKFEKSFYIGKVENETASIEPIILVEGFSESVNFNLTGELANHFDFTVEDDYVLIYMQMAIPEEQQPDNGVIILDLEASAPSATSAHTVVIFELDQNITESIEQLLFTEAYYTGSYTELDGLNFNETITLAAGYDDTVEFDVDGDNSVYFSLSIDNNSVTLTQSSSIPSAVLINNSYLIFTITAVKPNSLTVRTTIIISLTEEITETRILSFNRISYTGSIENNIASLEPIILSEGYETDVNFVLNGELSDYFRFSQQNETVLISLQDSISQEILDAHAVIVIEIQASVPQTMSAFATIVFEVMKVELEMEPLQFSHPYYTGDYNGLEGLLFDSVINLSHGYDQSVEFHLEEDNHELFTLDVDGNSVTLSLIGASIPENIINTYLKLIFVIIAEKPNAQSARATIVIALINDEESNTGASFEKILYQGLLQAGVVQHETIFISGYNGTDVNIVGEYSELFNANVLTDIVIVEGEGSVTLSEDVNYVVLELRVDSTSAVLLLDVIHSGTPPLPIVAFSSSSYMLRVDITQTGKIGQVEATADSGEQVSYSLQVEDDHLQQRLYIDEEGDIHLSAPANSGVYTFQVTATTIFTQATGVAQVHLTVDAITTCGQYEHVVPPLIIIDRDEEEPHRHLVTLSEEHQGCWFNMYNRWPIDQTWLYVDETGLHTTAIDREHESIAFMALSQVQVELILVCETDEDSNIEAINTQNKVNKTPINIHQRQDWLGPYDYGNNKWVITDTILFNPRRTFVNLIVNDINDNYPIFEDKQNEPVVVGYPVSELEERVIPRALIKLKATDADVGENASLVYWSSEDVLAVSPTTGQVHVRDVSTLTDGARLTVHATDRDGEGLTGSLEILVKMLDVSHIAVVTVRGAFLDDEEAILNNLSTAVGYEVKALRSTVIADSVTELNAIRKKRQTTTPTATLQIYIYGLVGGEPVDVDQLASNIADSELSTVNLVSTLSLEDHLGNVEICTTSTGLLVATIVLSVLLFILIVAAAVYFILLWRKKQNYEQFSDENSLASRNESIESLKPNPVVKPRLNIEELRRSERRLQEMLDAPIEKDTSPIPKEVPPETVNISIPEQPTPIVIQSIDKLKDSGDSDDDDEFGERMKAKRKSVVTFNENVERIIHVDNNSDNDSNDYEIYKF